MIMINHGRTKSSVKNRSKLEKSITARQHENGYKRRLAAVYSVQRNDRNKKNSDQTATLGLVLTNHIIKDS